MGAIDALLWVCAGLGAILVATISRIIAEDAKTLVPRLAENLIRTSAGRIHEDESSAFCEEWMAHLHDRKELTGKLWHALTIYLWGAGRVCRLVGYASKRPRSFRAIKRAFDVLLVLLAFPAVAAVCLPIAGLLVASGVGNPFHAQRRIGRNGKSFRIWKFRTMVPNPDQVLPEYLSRSPEARQEWNSFQKLRRDPRITRLGRFLRKSSIDELPQLWSVLCGDLSLVGPHPYLPGQEPADPANTYYRLTPGLTGLWQISDRNYYTLSDRTKADEEYFKRQSLLTDLRILIDTAGIVLLRRSNR